MCKPAVLMAETEAYDVFFVSWVQRNRGIYKLSDVKFNFGMQEDGI